ALSRRHARTSRRRRDASRRAGASGGRSALGGREAHKAPALFVIELQAQSANPIPQGQRWRFVEDGILIVSALQVVVGDFGVHVVHVVKPYVAGEELEDPRQLQV